MTRSDLLAALRNRLDDTVQPYRHTDADLNARLADAEFEAVERARFLVDSTTPAITRIALIPGIATYPLDPRVLFVARARIEGMYSDLLADILSETLRRSSLGWSSWPRRFACDMDTGSIALYPSPDASGVLLPAATMSAATWTAGELVVTAVGHGAQSGDYVTLAGYADGAYPVTAISGNDVTIAVDADPGAFMSGTLARHRRMLMTVQRLPLAPLADDADEPEIPARYHLDLLDWCCHLAYLARDADTESFQRAMMFEQKFTQRFGTRLSARDYSRLRRSPPTQLVPPRGGL